jgi:hypothetical protein
MLIAWRERPIVWFQASLEDGTDWLSRNVSNYQFTPRYIPEKRRSQCPSGLNQAQEEFECCVSGIKIRQIYGMYFYLTSKLKIHNLHKRDLKGNIKQFLYHNFIISGAPVPQEAGIAQSV